MIPLWVCTSVGSVSPAANRGVTAPREHRSLDESLGYAGGDRFVLFYYDPRLHEVRWRDTQSCGTGCSGWPPPLAEIEAQARSAGITLGHHNEPGDHALLIDRQQHQACVVYREEAQEFLARRSASAA